MPDKEKRPFLAKLIGLARSENKDVPSLSGQEPNREADREKNRPELKPKRAVIEKEPTRPHIGIDTKLTSEGTQQGRVRPGNFDYDAKVFFEPSGNGIDNSQVSKLSVRDARGKEVVHYDRGWDLKPEPGSPEAKAVKQIVAFYRDNARDMPYQDWPLENARSEAIASPQQVDNPMGFFEGVREPGQLSSAPVERSEGTGQGWTAAEKEAAVQAEREARESREAAENRQLDDPGREM